MALLLAAQVPAQVKPGFEVASIKESAPGSTGATMQFLPGGTVRISGMTAKNLITLAYGIQGYQVSGSPKWLDSTRYDINAKPEGAGGGTPAQMARIQGLLAERFQLRTHRESKPYSGYLLVVGKTGSKMQEARDQHSQGKGQILPMSMLATSLGRQLECPVVDRTGLKGNYFVMLRWTSDGDQPMGLGTGAAGSSQAAGDLDKPPSIFTAVQEQLGLRLEAGKLPIEVLVIDHIDRPSEN